MKRIVVYFLIGTGLYCQGQQDAASYFAKVDGGLRQVQQAEWRYARAAARARPKKVEKERHELLAAISQASAELTSLSAWNASSALRDTALLFLGVLHAVVNDDYGKVADLEPIAESAFDAMEAFIAARHVVEARCSRAAAAVEAEYHRFATQNGLQLVADPLYGGQIKQASAALGYYNIVYQIFFTNYKQEAYLLDAIEAADVSAIDQNRQALGNSAASGLAQLDSLGPYDDDNLRASCRKLLRFYQHEAGESLAEAASYFVEKADIDRQSLAVSNLRAGEQDPRIDAAHSEAKTAFKKRSENFARTSAVLARRRQSLLAAWQKSAEHFVKKHVR